MSTRPVVCIYAIDGEEFLLHIKIANNSVSDALVLAVPCDFGGHKPQEVTTYIVGRLREFLDGRGAGILRTYDHTAESYPRTGILKHRLRKHEHMLIEIDIAFYAVFLRR